MYDHLYGDFCNVYIPYSALTELWPYEYGLYVLNLLFEKQVLHK